MFFILFLFSLNNLIIVPKGNYKIGMSAKEADILNVKGKDSIYFTHPQFYELRNNLMVMEAPVTWKDYKICVQKKECNIPDYPPLWKNYFILSKDEYEKYLMQNWGLDEKTKDYIKNLIEGNYPVEVPYEDAVNFCKFNDMRLPSLYEYEAMQRGGINENVYFWGDQWDNKYVVSGLENANKNSLIPVKSKLPNKFGLYDISGNVFEHTSSYYCENNGFIFEELSECKNNCSNCLIIIKGGSARNKLKQYYANAIFKAVPNVGIRYGFRCVKQQ